mgnify:CR=1 FL=1
MLLDLIAALQESSQAEHQAILDALLDMQAGLELTASKIRYHCLKRIMCFSKLTLDRTHVLLCISKQRSDFENTNTSMTNQFTETNESMTNQFISTNENMNNKFTSTNESMIQQFEEFITLRMLSVSAWCASSLLLKSDIIV